MALSLLRAHSKISAKSVPVRILPGIAKGTLLMKVMDLEMGGYSG